MWHYYYMALLAACVCSNKMKTAHGILKHNAMHLLQYYNINSERYARYARSLWQIMSLYFITQYSSYCTTGIIGILLLQFKILLRSVSLPTKY